MKDHASAKPFLARLNMWLAAVIMVESVVACLLAYRVFDQATTILAIDDALHGNLMEEFKK